MSDRTCFVIAPIGEPESDVRKRSDQVLKHIIGPATVECGYNALRADQISEPGMITSQVIQHIVEDPLVIADLTGRNPNVFYELAVRHAIRRPFVQLIQKGEQIPFDVAGTRTIQLDHRDLDSVASARQQMVEQIRALEKSPEKLETPISVSLDLQSLRQSGNPEDRSLAEVLSALADLRANLVMLGNRVEMSLEMTATMARRQDVETQERLDKQFARMLGAISRIENDKIAGYSDKISAFGELMRQAEGDAQPKVSKGKLYPPPT